MYLSGEESSGGWQLHLHPINATLRSRPAATPWIDGLGRSEDGLKKIRHTLVSNNVISVVELS